MQRDNLYLNVLDSHLDYIDLCNVADYWTFKKKEKEVDFYHSKSDLQLKVKCEFIINENIQIIENIITNVENVKKYNKKIVEASVLEKINTNTSIKYIQTKSFSFCDNRDFIFLSGKRSKNDGSVILCSVSVNIDDYPEKSNIIRGSMFCGYVLVPYTSKKCKVIFFGSCDPKGAVPKFVLTFINNSLLENVIGLRDYIWYSKILKTC